MWQELALQTKSRVQFVDVSDLVEQEIKKCGVQEGFFYLFVPHTTAGITINENADPDVIRDLTVSLERLVPRNGDYQHGEGNSDAHLKASLMGFSCMVPIRQGHLDVGTWQGIYFCEFDGPRQRRVKFNVVSD